MCHLRPRMILVRSQTTLIIIKGSTLPHLHRLKLAWEERGATIATTIASGSNTSSLETTQSLIIACKLLWSEHPSRRVCIRPKQELMVKYFEKGLTDEWLTIRPPPCSRLVGAYCLHCCWSIHSSHLLYDYDEKLSHLNIWRKLEPACFTTSYPPIVRVMLWTHSSGRAYKDPRYRGANANVGAFSYLDCKMEEILV